MLCQVYLDSSMQSLNEYLRRSRDRHVHAGGVFWGMIRRAKEDDKYMEQLKNHCRFVDRHGVEYPHF